MASRRQDFLVPIGNGEKEISERVEDYLKKRDGVDKLLKIARYATKIIIASSIVQGNEPLNGKLKSFESSIGTSRKALKLGKFIQDVNALKKLKFDSKADILPAIAYGGEGLYFFLEQFVWLSKSGLIDSRHSSKLQKIGASAELIGYVGSISLKFMELQQMVKDRDELSLKIRAAKIEDRSELEYKMRQLEAKEWIKQLSLVQDWADTLLAFADVRGGKGFLTNPLLLSSAGLLSALISTYKIWVSL